MTRDFTLAAICVCCLCITAARGNVQLPAIFSDHMVLQQDLAAPVWGWADSGEKISVSFAGQTKTTQASADGAWKVQLDKLAASEQPQTLSVQGKNTLTIRDVLVGEVWLCSGQSNMAMPVSAARDFPQEQAAARLPQLRMFKETSNGAPEPQSKCNGKWELCSPESVGGFAATAYFFGRDVHKSLARPVGLINSSVGGTPIESWTSLEAQKSVPELQPLFKSWADRQMEWSASWNAAKEAEYQRQFAAWKQAVAQAKKQGATVPRAPSKPIEPRVDDHSPAHNFNGKIAPLIPYAIRGTIWYQGEANMGQGQLYGLQLALLIQDWRLRWGQGDLPFAWVQLPNFHPQEQAPVRDTGWVLVREGMLKTLRLPNTGMAVTIDVGEANNGHPLNKQAVGNRLALWALSKVYGRPGASSGPLPLKHQIAGSQIIVSFEHCDGGLVSKGGELKGFAIAGANKKWIKATATINGDTVILSSPEVPQPAAVRYAWADNPDCNLYNGAGLPASPFRTDDWPTGGEAKKPTAGNR